MFTKRVATSLLFLISIAVSQTVCAAPNREFYELKIYHLTDKAQADRLDTFLQKAYLPALHRAGVGKVGVFKPVNGADTLVYLLLPFKSADHFLGLAEKLSKDKAYLTAGADYVDAAFDNPVYKGFESILLEAFEGMPMLVAPALKSGPEERIYELRRYEAASEKLHENKISQFNNGELDIFKRLGFNTVFCGQVKAGGKLPSLMYMTSFENKAEQDAHWKAFSADPEWIKFNAKPEYAHNYLRADIHHLRPAPYSEI